MYYLTYINHTNLTKYKSKIFGLAFIISVMFSGDIAFAQYTPEQEFNKGVASYQGRDYQKAIEYFNQFLQSRPENAYAYNYLGLCYLGLNNKQSALDNFGTAIQLAPNFDAPYLNRGNLYLTDSMYTDAISDLNNAIQINPQNYQPYYDRGRLYLQQGNPGMALSNFNSAFTLAKGSDGVVSDFVFSDIYSEMALAQFQINDSTHGFEDINKALELNSQSFRAYYIRAIYYLDKGEQMKALSDLNYVIQYNPRYHEAYYERGKILVDLKSYENALNDFKTAIELHPSYKGELQNQITELEKKVK